MAWGPAVPDALKAAEMLRPRSGVSVEVIDLRSLVPLDMETILDSVRKTGPVRGRQPVHFSIGSFTGEIASRIMAEGIRLSRRAGHACGGRERIAPQSHILEAAFLPNANDIATAAKSILFDSRYQENILSCLRWTLHVRKGD